MDRHDNRSNPASLFSIDECPEHRMSLLEACSRGYRQAGTSRKPAQKPRK
jgi:hypothetical protein